MQQPADQWQTPEKAREWEARYRSLFEDANDGIFLVSREGRFVAVNRKYTEMTGFREEDLIGQTTEILLPGGLAQSLERIEQTIRNGKLGPYELETLTPLGTKVFSLNSFAHYENGAPVGIMCIARDVTEERRRKEQQALYQLAHDLACAVEVRTMADHLFAHARNLLGADYGFVMLADTDRKALRGIAAYGMDSETFRHERLELDTEQTPAGLAFQQQHPVVVANFACSPLLSERMREQYGFMESCWVVPLMSGEAAVGIFAVGYAVHKEATAEEMRLLQLLGHEAALAIERARLTEELRESEDRYYSLFENAPDGIVCLTAEGVITSVNRGFQTMLGWSREELIGQSYKMCHAPSSLIGEEDRIRRLRAGAKVPSMYEVELVHKDGRCVPCEVRTRFIRNSAGKPIGVLAILRDITERKRMEHTLARALNEQENILRTIPDIFYMLDLGGHLLKWNRELEVVTGFAPEELAGKHALDFFAEADQQTVGEAIRTAFAEGYVEIEGRLLQKDGTVIPYQFTSAPLKDEQGNVVGLTGVGRNVAERKRIEAALQHAKEAAEAANRAKSEFLANMSHEIRTPMNGVIGMTDLLLETELTPEQREYGNTVRSSAEALLGILNDILDFSKIEARKLALEQVVFILRESVGDALKTLALRAAEKGLELLYDVTPEVPEVVRGDPSRLRQVIVNLVGNAIKFTDRGEVVVRIELEWADEEMVELHVLVKDTGVGIPADKQSFIFDAFSQADASTTRHYGGTGLGLAISRQLVELMGGKLWMESTVGQGSTFHFTVRLGRGHALAVPIPALPDQLHSLRVLVVDDNATNRRILHDLLGSWHMQPTLASSAQEALALFHQATVQGQPFPLLLTDAHMPEMDGFTLVEQITQDPRHARVTILMLTSAEQRADIERCRQLGIAVYLIKPIKPAELRQAMLRALGQELQDRYPSEDRSGSTCEPLRILLVEDNAVNQKLAVRLLQKWGHTVMVAGNGKEALAALERDAFDLVLMDMQMPEMDGLEATARIRQREQSTKTRLPIIAMTAHAMAGDKERCLAGGMDDYVSKPLNTSELQAALGRIGTITAQFPKAATCSTVPQHEAGVDSVEL